MSNSNLGVGVRVGAAAFVLGLSLAGPQAAGVAAADTGNGDETSVSADSSAVGGSAKAGRGAARPNTGASRRSQRTVTQDREGPRRVAVSAKPGSRVGIGKVSAGRDGGSQSILPRQSAASPAAWVVAAVQPEMATTGGVSAAVRTRSTADHAVEPVADQIRTASETFFNRLANSLNDLPVNDVTNYLEGALLMVRKTLFNYGPQVAPSTPYTSGDGTVRGRIGGFDAEGDALTYRVIAGPTLGSVTIGADGGYVYTPGAGYDGVDSFAVEVAATRPSLSLNLLTPFANDDVRVVEVQVGAPLPAEPFDGSGQSQQARNDIALYLPNAAGHITVRKSPLGNLFTATVTLAEATPDDQVMWMDSTGDLGQLSLERALQLWPEFQAKAIHSGGSMDLGVTFTAEDDTSQALLLSNVSMSQDAAGQYVLTGQLTPDTEVRPDAVDRWDVVGLGLKSEYEDFRTTYSIDASRQFTTADLDFRNAAMFADTASSISFEQYGLYAFDHQQVADLGDEVAPTALSTSNPITSDSSVTASIPLGQSFVIGRQNGSLELWTDGKMQEDLRQFADTSIVQNILAYDRPLQDAEGNLIAGNFTGSITGNVLTVTALGPGSTVEVGQEITGVGVTPGTYITEFIVPETGRCIEQSGDTCNKYTGGQGGSDGQIGTYRVSKAQTVVSTVITQPATLATAPGFIVGWQSGKVRLWSATDGWVDLHSTEWPNRSTISTLANYGDGIAVGFDDGSVWKWDGPAGTNLAAWNNNWHELLPRSANGSVKNLVVVPRTGDAACSGSNCDDGVVVTQTVSTPPSVRTLVQFIPSDGGPVVKMKDLAQDQGILDAKTAIISYADGVALGYSKGSVLYWDLRHPDLSPVVLKQQDGQSVTAMASYHVPGSNGSSLVVSKGSNASLSMYTGGTWTSLQNPSWGSDVTNMTTFNSADSSTPGIIVTLADKSVQQWYRGSGTTSNVWKQVHNNQWIDYPNSLEHITTMIPVHQDLVDSSGNVVARDGVVVGFESGAVQQWSGVISGGTGQNEWTQLVCGKHDCGTAPGPSPTSFSQETLKAAVAFAKEASEAGAVWKTNVGSSADPLFHPGSLRAACETGNKCDGQFLPFATVINMSPLKKEWKAEESDEGLGDDASVEVDASLVLSYDVNAIAYGYAFMPNGFWSKLAPGKWSMSVLAAVETGPALTVNLGEDGAVIHAPRTNLLDWDYSTPGPLLVDRFALGLGVDGEFGVGVQCGDAACPEKLEAHAYLVPGVLFAYNTQSKPSGVGLGANWYPDLSYSDFAKVTGASLSATLTPYATMDYGIFAPDGWWLIGGWSLFKLGVGYENPLSATVAAGVGAPVSMTIGAAGYLTTHAGILEAVTSKLSWDNSINLYDVNATYRLT